MVRTCDRAFGRSGLPTGSSIPDTGGAMPSEPFHPPANLPDMDAIPYGRDAWDVAMRTFFRQGVQRATRWVGRGNSQFVDYLAHPPQGALDDATITWNGFPKSLYVGRSQEQAWERAEAPARFDDGGRTVLARLQDEYLEWHSAYDANGRIASVDFTCEGPEYWMALAHGYPTSIRPGRTAPRAEGSLDVVLALYRQHV